MTKNSNQKLRKAIFRLLGSFALVVTSICFSIASVFAWFSVTKTPRTLLSIGTSGYDVDIEVGFGGQAISYNGDFIACDFSNILCGSSSTRYLSLVCTNNATQAVSISFLFLAPRLGGYEEAPFLSDGYYYYLGSQLCINDIAISCNGVVMDIDEFPNAKGEYLLSTASDEVDCGQNTAVAQQVSDPSNLVIVSNIALLHKKATTVTIAITFVDNRCDQSIYQSPFLGSCNRRLAFVLS